MSKTIDQEEEAAMSGSATPPQPNMMFDMGALSGGRNQKKKAATNTKPPVVDPMATGNKAGNAGFERYMAVDQGRRGGRVIKAGGRAGALYKDGAYKGMTQGEGDAIAERHWQKVPEKVRDQFRPQNEGDLTAARGRSIEAAKDQFELARGFQKTIRDDIASEQKTPPTDPKTGGAGSFDPNVDPNAPPAAETGVVKPSPVADPAKRTFGDKLAEVAKQRESENEVKKTIGVDDAMPNDSPTAANPVQPGEAPSPVKMPTPPVTPAEKPAVPTETTATTPAAKAIPVKMPEEDPKKTRLPRGPGVKEAIY